MGLQLGTTKYPKSTPFIPVLLLGIVFWAQGRIVGAQFTISAALSVSAMCARLWLWHTYRHQRQPGVFLGILALFFLIAAMFFSLADFLAGR